jgi:hypothetical protein
VNRKDPWTTAGLVVVGVTALIWSFTALSDLAHRCGVTAVIQLWDFQAHVSWGLPITVDVLALVATRVWLNRAAPEEAVTYARRAAWSAIVATVIGNGYHGLIVGNFAIDAVIVSAAPAVVIGVIVHLAVLVGRPEATQPTDEESTAEQAPMVWLTDEAATLDYAGFEELADQFPTDPTDADRPELDPPMTDGQIIAEVKAWAAELERRPSRDEMLERYKIGATRCRRLRNLLGWIEPLDQSDQPRRQPVEAVGSGR